MFATGVSMKCEECVTSMKQVPGKPYFYSDHTAVQATFTLVAKPDGRCKVAVKL